MILVLLTLNAQVAVAASECDEKHPIACVADGAVNSVERCKISHETKIMLAEMRPDIRAGVMEKMAPILKMQEELGSTEACGIPPHVEKAYGRALKQVAKKPALQTQIKDFVRGLPGNTQRP